jgi:hypothetical protein
VRRFKAGYFLVDLKCKEARQKSFDWGCILRAVTGIVVINTVNNAKYALMLYDDYCRVSSGSIVSDYGLDDRAIGVRSPAGAEDFSSSLCVQTGSGAHPSSCPMVPGVLSPGVKARPGRDADHSPPSSAEVKNE